MKILIIAEIGSSFFTKYVINQFDDVKIEAKVEDKVFYTLPDGTIPANIELWQSMPDPVIEDGFVIMKSDRPSEGDWIASKKGTWVRDISQIIAKNEVLKTELMQEAVNQISLLQDIIDLDMQESNEDEQLKAWKKYRILLTRIDASDVNVVFPSKPE